MMRVDDRAYNHRGSGVKTHNFVTWPSSIAFVPKPIDDMLQLRRTQRGVAARLQPLHKSKKRLLSQENLLSDIDAVYVAISVACVLKSKIIADGSNSGTKEDHNTRTKIICQTYC
jgi:hypothetical protein